MTENSVKIAVRERPSKDSREKCVDFVSKCVVCDSRPFVFDQIFRSESSQVDVFTSLAAPLVAKTLEGFNSTLFAYGQSGTGKSFSMGLNPDSFGSEAMGIIPRSFEQIFENVENSGGQTISISCSFLEIYNEKAYDLFDSSNIQKPMHRPNDSVKKEIKSVKGAFQLLREAHKIRRIRSTSLNSESSRAHSIVTIHIFKDNGNGSRIKSCLNLVDLAGTEGVRKTGHQGMALTEGNHINSSLLAISKIINTLSIGMKPISFRDSVLTRVLQESFSLNCYLALLVCISSSKEDLTETKSALQFAKNAKNITMSSQLSKEIEIIKKNTPRKLPFASASKINGTAKKRTLSSTFNSVSKVPRLSATKINQSEMFKRPPTQRQLAFEMSTAISPPSVIESIQHSVLILPNDNRTSFGRKSSIGSMDSRFSMQSLNGLNVSSSTVIDEFPNTRHRPSTSSESPLIRKCMDVFNSAMSKKLDLIHESLQTPAPQKSSIDTEIIRTMIRQELTQLLATTNKNSCAVIPVEESPMKQYSRRSRDRSLTPSLPSINEEDVESSPVGDSTIVSSNKIMEKHKIEINFVEDINTSTPKRVINDSSTESHETVFKIPQIKRRIEASTNIASPRNTSFMAPPKNLESSPLRRIQPLRRSMRLSVCRTPPNLNENNLRKKMMDTRRKELPPPTVSKRKPIEKFVLHPKDQRNKKNMKKEMETNLLNLFNNGDLKDIQKLPTFGPKRAQTAVTFRIVNGPFENFSNIREIPIWSDKTWSTFLSLNCLN
ncbi:hypothetical protein ACFFRR_003291 [Megaselia abdita]